MNKELSHRSTELYDYSSMAYLSHFGRWLGHWHIACYLNMKIFTRCMAASIRFTSFWHPKQLIRNLCRYQQNYHF